MKDVAVEVKCRQCEEGQMVLMSESQFLALKLRAKRIQEIFPDLSPDIRELFVSGLCGKCFDALFAEPWEREVRG